MGECDEKKDNSKEDNGGNSFLSCDPVKEQHSIEGVQK